ncbi:MAG: aminoglycoside phosphotransferase family protein [Oscillochloris sp.]|nr:aminoglycoside phosphotransferase family protein [Oscillochloris sp.]
MSDTSLPLPVAALAEHALGATITHSAPTVGGFSNLSRRILIGGRSCVIKAAQLPIKRADLRHEASILPLLPALNVPAPHLIAFAEDDSWSVLISAELPGQPGVTLLETNHADLPTAFGALGTLLARLHTALAPNLPHLNLVPRLAAARAMLDTAADIDDDLRRGLLAALYAVSWDQQAPCLIHGDAGMHNVLWDGGCAARLHGGSCWP